MKRKKVKKTRNTALWTTVILWMMLIYFLSSQVALDSYELSNRINNIIFRLIEKIALPSDFDIIYFSNFIRKTGHFLMYFILGILVLSLLRGKLSRSKRLGAAMLICIIFALTDEFHQMFVPGRTPLVSDILIDILGSFFGILVKLVLETSVFKKFNDN
ncbi:VanZ like family protein [Dethiosulfatibacter aminovorans DSM 17477]|uniref:VanZ like family protein n=1 Tax=Dethiosulfatibacter aminovorans DSM 17477 TaxID=1121476 RepID=A0A1M6E8Y2_9FIRM|nr:VanZ family protein [Dethiosulfatibacter aminovorans]SHI81946.1 VanZ like family protein [Dethiosulfatibacter aminovorans DSM 17477]